MLRRKIASGDNLYYPKGTTPDYTWSVGDRLVDLRDITLPDVSHVNNMIREGVIKIDKPVHRAAYSTFKPLMLGSNLLGRRTRESIKSMILKDLPNLTLDELQELRSFKIYPTNITSEVKGTYKQGSREKVANVVRTLLKKADYPPQPLSFQRYLPISSRRELEEEERDEINSMSDRLIPKIWVSKSTPMTHLLASPSKQSLAVLAGSGIIGAGVGGAFGGLSGAARGAGIGMVPGSILATMKYYLRKRENENIVESMRRLPLNATVRDMEADPVYQKEQDRLEAARARAHENFMRNLSRK